MDVELASCAHRRAAIVRFAPRAQLQGGEAQRTKRSQEGKGSRLVRGSYAPGRHSGKLHALDVLVLEIPIAKFDLRVEIADLLILTESPASGKRGVYLWVTGPEPVPHFGMCAIIGMDGEPSRTLSLPKPPWL